MIHQDPSHEARRQREKMTSVLQRDIGLNQAQEGLVNDRRRLQSVAAAFCAHVIAGQPPQLVVDQRRQTVECLRMTRSPLGQKLREIGWNLHRRSLTHGTKNLARIFRFSPKGILPR